jgi:hypothetical protein
MEDTLVIRLLRSKGIITDNDIKELSEDIMETEVIDSKSMTEKEAKELVSCMYHIEGNKKYIGEKYSLHKAKEVHTEYSNVIPHNITCYDIYVAINAQYHNYIKLYKSWFDKDLDHKVIESAMHFWFMDSDYKHLNKVLEYFSK